MTRAKDRKRLGWLDPKEVVLVQEGTDQENDQSPADEEPAAQDEE